ncbi:similar to Saccharomyces cerevisiae YOR148C SPP2 Essential protein that promotes the first step of splicing and is required for the final stages of spliceosome maturation [Maudiozyma barnettii]|uniref:Pre-mRNA-splicing factor n=1 Tax=Maudiozyma barnettii TaxID=61262 RepID=A0A8H2VBP5_9SACH|nr:Spp2p [Kazachstania barnettii]CAB4252330.1 similar to Saccharomyces cerevisiae YOR148C SPP2 Essential protein that promotes the first step of splicing and is required for the final stages of spliceosome maturation [Kazachstania barnettii]CAD1779064.1 similar to Saccharomyces cerevisiae YOR148C SPP2 Essential protein that promotes the first step of splicing and is required for the final stages of spliceosome maturation [Kazachstania barnettii]
MSVSFNFDLKKKKSSNKSKGKKKRDYGNIFGDITLVGSSVSNDINASQVNKKRRKIKITEVSQHDLSNERPKEDDLVIVLGEDHDGKDIQTVTTLNDYKSVPVEQFGSAILRGMGWNGKSENDTNNKSEDILKSAHVEGLGIGAKGDTQITDTQSFMPLIKLDKKDGKKKSFA